MTWLALSLLAWGGIAAIVFLVPSWEWAYVPLSEDYFWIMRLRFEVMPVVGIAALVAPVVSVAALLVRRWRPAVLALVGAVAMAQYAYVGFEIYLQTVELPGPSLPEGVKDWPAWENSGQGVRQ
jgi:hypothetical protein